MPKYAQVRREVDVVGDEADVLADLLDLRALGPSQLVARHDDPCATCRRLPLGIKVTVPDTGHELAKGHPDRLRLGPRRRRVCIQAEDGRCLVGALAQPAEQARPLPLPRRRIDSRRSDLEEAICLILLLGAGSEVRADDEQRRAVLCARA